MPSPPPPLLCNHSIALSFHTTIYFPFALRYDRWSRTSQNLSGKADFIKAQRVLVCLSPPCGEVLFAFSLSAAVAGAKSRQRRQLYRGHSLMNIKRDQILKSTNILKVYPSVCAPFQAAWLVALRKGLCRLCGCVYLTAIFILRTPAVLHPNLCTNQTLRSIRYPFGAVWSTEQRYPRDCGRRVCSAPCHKPRTFCPGCSFPIVVLKLKVFRFVPLLCSSMFQPSPWDFIPISYV